MAATNSNFTRGLPSSGNCKRPRRINDKKRGLLARGELARRIRRAAMERDERKELTEQAVNMAAKKRAQTMGAAQAPTIRGRIVSKVKALLSSLRRKG